MEKPITALNLLAYDKSVRCKSLGNFSPIYIRRFRTFPAQDFQRNQLSSLKMWSKWNLYLSRKNQINSRGTFVQIQIDVALSMQGASLHLEYYMALKLDTPVMNLSLTFIFFRPYVKWKENHTFIANVFHADWPINKVIHRNCSMLDGF